MILRRTASLRCYNVKEYGLPRSLTTVAVILAFPPLDVSSLFLRKLPLYLYSACAVLFRLNTACSSKVTPLHNLGCHGSSDLILSITDIVMNIYETRRLQNVYVCGWALRLKSYSIVMDLLEFLFLLCAWHSFVVLSNASAF